MAFVVIINILVAWLKSYMIKQTVCKLGVGQSFSTCFSSWPDKIKKYCGGLFTFIKKHKMITASLGKLMLLSSQSLWLIENSAEAHIRAMARTLKTSGVEQLKLQQAYNAKFKILFNLNFSVVLIINCRM